MAIAPEPGETKCPDCSTPMVRAGVTKAGLDYKRGYTLQFVNKGVGAELRPKK